MDCLISKKMQILEEMRTKVRQLYSNLQKEKALEQLYAKVVPQMSDGSPTLPLLQSQKKSQNIT